MLTRIFVKNFVLFDQVELDFQSHMSAFTGETGAGKSLLIDAINILKGERVSSSLIKEHQEKAVIEGVFELRKQHPIYEKLDQYGIDASDGVLVVSREILKDGKSTARVNHRVVTLTLMKDLMKELIDIHSQHDTYSLLNSKYHLQLLDDFCQVDELKKEVNESFQTYHAYQKELEIALHQDYNEDDLEFLTFQFNEIEQANIKPEELETLEQEQKHMQNYEKINEHVNSACECLEGSTGALAPLYSAYKELQGLEEPFWQECSQKLLDYYYEIDEIQTSMRKEISQMEFDEARFHEISERIFFLHKILRKYGPTFEQVEKKKAELEHHIDMILHRQDYIKKQEEKVKQAYDGFMKKAEQLHEVRVSKAKELSSLVEEQLHDLALEHARFSVQFETHDGNADGIDRVQFYGSMNAAMSPRPLANVASGGELSRLMLGLKTVFSKGQSSDTIIFDEIDTGVSGRIALAIGRKMKQIAQTAQVFCVTHLAQVAACADQHYCVEKQQKEQVSTTIRLLTKEETIEQLAMIASGSHSDHAIKAAEELYDLAQK